MNIKTRAFLLWPYFLLIAAGLMIPSDGNHGIISAKSISFILATLSLGFYAFWKQGFTLYQLKLVCFFLFALAFLLGSLFISMMLDQTTAISQLDQFKLFVITILFPLSTLYMVHEDLITMDQIFKAVIYFSFFYVLSKVILVFLQILGWINLWAWLETLEIRFMRMSIDGELERVQTSVDIVTPFLIFFVLQAERLGISLKPTFKWIYLALSLFSTFLSFSRYLIFVYAVSCFLYWMTLNSRKMVKAFLMILVFSFAAYLIVTPEKFSRILERRVFSMDNFQSDAARVSQIRSLLAEFGRAPWIGKGIGGYAEGNIRDKILLHNYEVQWFAFLMQFGVVGILFLLAPLCFICYRLMIPFSKIRWSFLGLYLLWLLSGFTNPFLISLTSGIMYALFLLSAEKLNAERRSLLHDVADNPC